MLVVALVVVVLAGCARPADRSPEAWVVSVCRALAPWRAEITELNQRTATQMRRTSTVEQTRRNLVDLVTDASEVTETARAAVEAAGVPDAPAGAAIARSFELALSTTRDAYSAAADDLLALPGGDETAFYDGVVDVMDRLNRQYAEAGAKLSELDSPELQRAFDSAPECQ